ncbi:MAG: DNA cytosine methyltransferase [Eubacteriales bacterium]
MNVLVACEESQAVCKAFRGKGHCAFSCDIEPNSGGHEEWHIQQDVLPLLNGNCTFTTCDGKNHKILGQWDMILAFPSCQFLTSAGTRHFSPKCNPPEKIKERERLREEAVAFFLTIYNADCEKKAIENPVGYMNTHFMKPSQIVHPYYFGEPIQKRTCLWLQGLPNLEPTNMLPKPEPEYFCQGAKCNGKAINWVEGIRGTTGGQKGRAKARSKTFLGIAQAMADQWGG